ncbi:hypothetical protein A7985_22715 [Pseudoalteromonas luteoviolacea]|uniref:Uncharacterized protein n=1 Tax=Pseudoalteromonas luteoviolacea TaxID=43657 RepID=A0A1C0TKH8_9GAMM|nr:SDR family NAD(P)-dependent oxidoreductase [Pseudoalteromonas luteoviolacea]OCQ18831.1 hypothetical protein A7985_22715 [Pseudoalteromonas luteoviolacea]
MKGLEEIYRRLSVGELSREQALQEIRLFKAKELESSTLLATPSWETEEVNLGDSDKERDHISLSRTVITNVALPLTGSHSGGVTYHQVTLDENKDVSQKWMDFTLGCFAEIKRLLVAKPKSPLFVQVVIACTGNDEACAGIAGLLKAAALENPLFFGQLILVEDLSPREVATVVEDEAHIRKDILVKYSAHKRAVFRWQTLSNERLQQPLKHKAIKEGGVYLISGGGGGLGKMLAEEIIAQSPTATLVLLGRSSLSEAQKNALSDMAPKGQVRYEAIDVCDGPAVAQLVEHIVQQYGQLNGIVHCAGVLVDNFIISKSEAEFERVMAPKVQGVINLDRASQQATLDFFAIFSSGAAVVGNVGQSDYATANGFADHFALFRNTLVAKNQRHGHTLSINWPYWQEGGMVLTADEQSRLQSFTGMTSLSTELGMTLFHRLLHTDLTQVLVVSGNSAELKARLKPHEINLIQLPEALAGTVSGSATEALVNTAAVAQAATHQTQSTPHQDLPTQVSRYLQACLSRVLKIPAVDIATNTPLDKYGIDSIVAMKLIDSLEEDFGSLAKTLFFEYGTLEELAEYFIDSHLAAVENMFKREEKPLKPAANETRGGQVKTPAKVREQHAKPRKFKPSLRFKQSPSRATAQAADIPASAESIKTVAQPAAMTPNNAHTLTDQVADRQREHKLNTPIAIIGMSGRYPESPDLAQYWDNLAMGRDCVREVPKSRWDWREYYSEDRTVAGHHYSKWGGFIEGVDEFDPRFFNISPKEAMTLDPQERLFLQHAWMAMEDAGYTRDSLQIPREKQQSGQVGVYAGVMYSEYQMLGAEASMRGQRMGFANTPASIANRVSYVLNTHGPSMTVDTMCSSSLTAIHLACQDLKMGRTDMALAGGVNITIHPNKYLMLSGGQFISSDGHCQSFGEGGDGYIPGEGVGVVVLKLLDQAEADGDAIHGVIRGSALNHGGRTNGYSVPNPNAQACAIEQALADAKVDPRHIGYIEAHGTGTKLGDPIEIAGLSKAFYRGVERVERQTGYCLIGSAKSNIGHGEAAAGVAGLAKVLLQMRHRQIVPSLHSKQLNPNIDFNETPFIVNQTLVPWQAPVADGRTLPRLAGISSFGAGGSNAHLIVEEYIAPTRQATSYDKVIVPLSARTLGQLKGRIKALSAHLETLDNDELTSLAYTLQVGREAMDERVCFVVDSVAQLQAGLLALSLWQRGEPLPGGVFYGQVKAEREALAALRDSQDLTQRVSDWLGDQQLTQLGEVWVKGQAVAWHELYQGVMPARMHLPVYPFAKERYWVEIDDNAVIQHTVKAADGHPLLQVNTSTVKEHSYRTHFSGTESFITRQESVASVPETVCLEMARVAVEQGLAVDNDAKGVILSELVWGAPIIVPAGGKSVSISLFNPHHDDSQIEFEIYSQDDAGEVIHCQGRGQVQSLPAAQPVAGIKAGLSALPVTLPKGVTAVSHDASQLLIEFALPSQLAPSLAVYSIHPEVVDTCFTVIGQWLAAHDLPISVWHAAYPQALSSLAVQSANGNDIVVHVRRNQETQNLALSLRFCDVQGRCYQHWDSLHFATPERSESNLAERDIAVAKVQHMPQTHTTVSAAPQPGATRMQAAAMEQRAPVQLNVMREVPLPVVAPSADASCMDASSVPATTVSKPNNVVLKALEQATFAAGAPLDRPRFSLVQPSALLNLAKAPQQARTGLSSETPLVRLYEFGHGVYRLTLQSGQLSEALVLEMVAALDYLSDRDDVNTLLLCGGDDTFLVGQWNNPSVKALYQRVVAFSAPIIAVLAGDAKGAGLCLAALCDQMICNEAAQYGLWLDNEPRTIGMTEQSLWRDRFGHTLAADLLFMTASASGATWQRKGWRCPVVPAAQVETHAKDWASHLASKSAHALQTLKGHLAMSRQTWLDALAEPSNKTHSSDAQHSVGKVSNGEGVSLREAGRTLYVELAEAPADSQVAVLIDTIHGAVDSGYSSMVISSQDAAFLPAITANDTALDDLIAALSSSPLLVVAALTEQAQGRAWLVAQSCDAVVYSRSGQYGDKGDWTTSDMAFPLLRQRVGETLSQQLLLRDDTLGGAQLPSGIAHWYVCEQDDVMTMASQLTQAWQTVCPTSLGEWKAAAWAQLNEQQQQLSKASGSDLPDSNVPIAEAKETIALKSKVIGATAYPNGVVEVSMRDRDAKNMFSPDFVAGMEEAFAHIAQRTDYKVVVLTGYDHYFASGGTKDSLLAIQRGDAKFTDITVFQLPLNCDLPVIAAMQGHAIGAGWALGMFSDVTIFSEESHYISPYMNYGFTPGAGSTLLLPYKLGQDLGMDSLFSGQGYQGSALQARGLACPVLPRQDVVATAMAWAGELSKASRAQLMALKAQWRAPLLPQLEGTYASELAMHEATFVGRSDTLAQIQAQFASKSLNQDNPSSELQTPLIQDAEAVPSAPALLQQLKTMLAQELRMRPEELDVKEQFVDLGLDSITGVTWVRAINAQYQLDIEATQVYSYPTLQAFSDYVGECLSTRMPMANGMTTGASEAAELPASDQSWAPSLSSAALTQQLTAMLAKELRMRADELDVNEQFVDLGLDSITGVTWVRAINAKYQLDIEATQVYSYPTLQAFSDYVSDMIAAPAEVSAQAVVTTQAQPQVQVTSISTSEIRAQLSTLLAAELRINPTELDATEQFVDLGLDSITGVTWVRAINAKYQLDIEATEVYSYPTLQAFSEFVSGLIAPQLTAQQPMTQPVTAHQTHSTTAVKQQLIAMLATELRIHAAELDENEQFVDLGLDSITGVTWVRAINAQYQLDIEATQIYSYPTLRAFAEHVCGLIAAHGPSAEVAPVVVKAGSEASDTTSFAVHYATSRTVLTSRRAVTKPVANSVIEPIAIIGMSGQFAATENLTQYWHALAEGQDLIQEVPEERWSTRQFYEANETPKEGKTNSKWLGALTNYDTFDPLFFNLSPNEAKSMDPQQRLFLEACWNSIEDAGYAPQQLSGSRCGVFVGCAGAGYQLHSRELQLSAQGFTGDAMSILAARIAYFLNLQGPCISLDTACSSSLVAISQACDSLQLRDSDVALAGGVYVMSGPELHVKSAQAGMLSPDGRCYTFDQRANGFVPGEGVGAVMLKRLSDAQRDGDSIHALLKGWGINQDGKTNGITAPSAQSQSRLERSVYDKFGIDPEQIQLVEAHGTGTPLGDPIEVEGLKAAFKAYTAREAYCALGSVKSNIGHCLAAAGVAGVLKVILALKHRQLPPTLHVEQVNEHVSLKGSPFYINDALQPWQVAEGQRRHAVVSSFGFSGTNAHLVLGEAPETTPQPRVAVPVSALIPVSAKTPEQLTQRISALADYLTAEQGKVSLTDVAYTLQTGREAMSERLCVYTESLTHLMSQLRSYLSQEQAHDGKLDYIKAGLEAEGIFRESTETHKAGIQLICQDEQVKQTLLQQWLNSQQINMLGHMWSKGLELDWLSMYPAQKPQRLNLPSYPFSKDRYWVGRDVVPASKPAQPMFFTEQWQHDDAPAQQASEQPDHQVVIFTDPQFAPTLEQSGLFANAIYVEQGESPQKLSNRHYVCRADSEQEMLNVLTQVHAAAGKKLSVIFTWAKAQGKTGIYRLLTLFAALRQADKWVAQLTIAGHYDESEPNSNWDYAWIGIERSVKHLISAPVALLYHQAGNGLAQHYAAASQGNGVVLYRDNVRFKLANTALAMDAQDSAHVPLKQGGNYLITGGMGELGFITALHLAKNYGANLYLLGRRAPDQTTTARLAQLKLAGAHDAQYVSLDMGSQADIDAWLKQAKVSFHGIFHAAGVQSSAPFYTLSEAEIEQVIAPKTEGAMALERGLSEQALDFVCYFSSSSAVLGDAGNCAYAIASRFQMAQAKNVPSKAAKTLAINWPFWAEGGMGHNLQSELYLKSSGQAPLETEAGMRMLEQLLSTTHDQALVLVGDKPRLTSKLDALYSTTPHVNGQSNAPAKPLKSVAQAPTTAVAMGDVGELLERELIALASAQLGMAEEHIATTAVLSDYGFDSIGLARFATRLTEQFGVEVTPPVFFSHGTIEQLVAWFKAQHSAALATYYQTQPTAEVMAVAPAPLQAEHTMAEHTPAQHSAHEPIAIIGMSGRFPKADSVDAFWQLLENEQCAVDTIPAFRWDWREYYSEDAGTRGKMVTKSGAFIDNVDQFDPLFFEVSPREAELMDPAERMLLMESYKAIEDAGIDPASLRGRNVGVYVGMEESQYNLLTDEQGVTTGGAAMVSSRLSYFLDFHGPAIATNTACSSGLVALHQAVMSLRSNECELALAAAVALTLSPVSYVKMSEAGMLSQDGKCASFSDQAQGIGIGEAAVVLMLKPLSQAEADHDPIYGTVTASGVNFDGKTNGVTAPNGRMQSALIERIYVQQNVPVDQISHVVSHGTGTPLGDPVEYNALCEAFNSVSAQQNVVLPDNSCAITSTKSNFAHTLAASGLVSVVGLLKGMGHSKIPASIHCHTENSYINQTGNPFYINKQTRDWQVPNGQLKLGAVSAFGRSGTNAHVVISEYPRVRLASQSDNRLATLIPLSARTAAQLKQRAAALLSFINNRSSHIDNQEITLENVAYTLQVGRESMKQRVGFVATSLEELAQQLAAYLAGNGQAPQAIDSATAVELTDWLAGQTVDWQALYAGMTPSRIHLPTYTFADNRYWPETTNLTASQKQHGSHSGNAVNDSLNDVDALFTQVEEDALETSEAVALLSSILENKMLAK